MVQLVLIALLYFVLLIVIPILIIVLWHFGHKFITRRYLECKFQKLYLCGYDLNQIMEKNFLHKVERYLGIELCEMDAAIIMLALHGNETARIVCGEAKVKQKPTTHTWVEFHYLGRWYALDPSWYEDKLLTRREYRRGGCGVIQTLDYTEFWAFSTARQLHQKMSVPGTSRLFCELYMFTDNPAVTDILEEDSGKSFVPFWRIADRPVSANIFDLFMLERAYRAPTARDILKALHGDSAYDARII